MTISVARIYRHPVKSLGEEPLDGVDLTAACPMPWDRTWAVIHGGGAWDAGSPAWADCKNFARQAHVPEFSRIDIRYDEAAGRLTLTHPARPTIEIDPDTDEGAEALTGWIAPLADAGHSGPYRLARLGGGALTDDPEAHLLICSNASRRALEQIAGTALADVRFRANLWLDGLSPWQEEEWIGREIKVGAARLQVFDPCERCAATMANPETGQRDIPIPRLLLDHRGNDHFGVYARVVSSGRIARGDRVEA